jgi:hypothetical protein
MKISISCTHMMIFQLLDGASIFASSTRHWQTPGTGNTVRDTYGKLLDTRTVGINQWTFMTWMDILVPGTSILLDHFGYCTITTGCSVTMSQPYLN